MMIANPVTEQLLCLKRVAFKRTTTKDMVVLLPEDFVNESRLKIYIMCDSYIGLDQEYTIDLVKVNEMIAKQAREKTAKKQAQMKDSEATSMI